MKVGIVSFSDGRKRVAEACDADVKKFQKGVADWLEKEGHEVVSCPNVAWNWETCKSEGDRLADADVDAVIFNFAVWSYPDLTAQVAIRVDAPTLLLGNINPSHPGWVAFFASCGTMSELGETYGRALGDISEPEVQEEIRTFLREADPDGRQRGKAAAEKLYGMRYGHFDGPSMGMYTGHVDATQWMGQLGVQVYHRGQLHLANTSKNIAPERVEAGLKWLEDVCKEVCYDGEVLTPGLDGTLARQVRLYLATKDFCKEEGVDFMGLTGQLDFTESPDWCTLDIPEAILNDTADWEEENKKVIVTATECDSNAALTMQLMHLLTNTPVLFADLRHYHKDLDMYDLVNSGQHAPWLAKRSDNYRENWGEVRLMPASKFYFAGGGASVQFYAAPADVVTYARIVRIGGEFVMHMFTGAFVEYPYEKAEALGKQTTYEWPHVWAKFGCSFDSLKNYFCANHIHACIGDHVAALSAACEVLGIQPVVLR